MDIIYQISYPFNSEKQEVAKTEKRFRNILWNDDAFALRLKMRMVNISFIPIKPTMSY